MELPLMLKATLLLLAALAGACLCRRTPRRAHQMWTVVFVGLVVLPVLAAVLPPLAVRVPGVDSPQHAIETPVFTPVDGFPAPAADAGLHVNTAVASPPAVAETRRGTAATVVTGLWAKAVWVGAWVAGAAFAVAMILMSLLRVHRLSRSATELRDPAWRAAADDISRRLGMRPRVRLLISDAIHIPMAGEFWRPAVFLPAAARDWDAGCRETVLAHELVHLAAHDPNRHVAARVMLALYWFHPLAWIAARSSARACEDACDEAVLRLGVRPSAYARVLLQLAESADVGRVSAALPIVTRSQLERRVLAILDSRVSTAPVRQVPLPAAACAVLAVLLAPVQPRAGEPRPSASTLQRTDAMSGAATHGYPLISAQRPSPDATPEAHARAARLPPPGTSAQTAATTCWWDSTSASGRARPASGMVVTERVVSNGYTRAIQKGFGDLRLCLVAEALAGPDPDRPSAMHAQGKRAVLEVHYDGTVQQLETATAAAGPMTAWRVNGVNGPVDRDVDAWRQHVLAVLDSTWALATLRGEAQTLEARIALARTVESDSRVAALRENLVALDHDRRTSELEIRRQAQLTRLRQTVETIRRGLRVASSESTPSACDVTGASRVAGHGSDSRLNGRRRPRFLREVFGDLQVCLRIDEGNVIETVRPSVLMRRAHYSLLEARRGDLVHQLEIRRDESGAVHEEWRINGVSRPMDTAVERWKAQIVEVLDTSWEIWALQGQEGLLRGLVAEIQGQLAAGEIRTRDAERRMQSIHGQMADLKVNERIAHWSDRREDEVLQFRESMAAVR